MEDLRKSCTFVDGEEPSNVFEDNPSRLSAICCMLHLFHYANDLGVEVGACAFFEDACAVSCDGDVLAGESSYDNVGGVGGAVVVGYVSVFGDLGPVVLEDVLGFGVPFDLGDAVPAGGFGAEVESAYLNASKQGQVRQVAGHRASPPWPVRAWS